MQLPTRCLAIAGLAAIATTLAAGQLEVRSVIASGSDRLTGGTFELQGTIGQADAATLTSGPFTLEGGFWAIGDGALPCPADVSGNGTVDIADLNAVLASFGGPGAGDVDGNGTVDIGDLNDVLAVFGTDCP